MPKEPIRWHSLPTNQVGVQVYRVEPTDPTPPAGEDTVPHRHDHYSGFFVEQGSVEMLVDFQPVYVRAPALLVSPPGQLHQLGTLHEFQGWVLLADAKLITSAIRSSLEQALASVPIIILTATTQAWFQQVFSALHTATATQDDSWVTRTEVVPALLNALLGQAAALLAAQPPALQHAGRGPSLTNQFRQLVRQHFLTHKKPADYAAMLHVTGGYLNDTVKTVTGFSASYFIQQEVLAEARRLLCYSQLNSQEVADRLGYDDAKYFTRLFGKGTGFTPSQFRKKK